MRRGICVTAVSALVLFSVTGVSAQEQIRAKLPSIEVLPNPAADKLQSEAEALYAVPGRLRKAANLHEQEAKARTIADVRHVEALARAAQLYFYAGDAWRSRELMEKAARTALQRGDVLRAAHAFLDAAYIAVKGRDGERALELTHQAELLSLSPLIAASDRVAIVRRIDPARVSLGAL